ncbi:MAG TPA: alpha/beta hydrolase [Actinomycetota bacterium]|nr:alpha/beta hydrolase [Actinomycetota bacterium]
MSDHTIATRVGHLRVQETAGRDLPAAVLWHSLFVDERTWQRVLPDLAQHRRLVVITGPGHGLSTDPGHRYSMDDCADAALEVLDALEVAGPVDWVGNAWGGHVGLTVAARHPQRVRTLVTCGTPLHPYSWASRVQTNLLLVLYRLLGPTRLITNAVVDALLSQRTRSTDTAATDLVRDCFVSANRTRMANAVVSISLKRVDMKPLLTIRVPTLFITGSEHPDWTPDQMRAAAQRLPRGSTAVLDGTAYLGPLEAPDRFRDLVRDFWAAHPAPGQRERPNRTANDPGPGSPARALHTEMP